MEYVLGVLCGILVGGIIGIFVRKWTKKDGALKCKFDERQRFVRYKGFQYAFWTLAICNVIYALIDIWWEGKIIDTPMAMFLAIIVSIVLYACYCIWNEGYFALNENRKRVLIAFALIALLNFLVFARAARKDGLIENGVLAGHFINLICGLMFLIIFAVMLIKWTKDKREAE